MSEKTLKTPLRKNLAIAIDGGGIMGLIVARALLDLDEALDGKLHERVGVVAGTSAGAIIAGALAYGLTATEIYDLYCEIGPKVFKRTLLNIPPIGFLFPYRYSHRPLRDIFAEKFQGATIGSLDSDQHPDLIITATDAFAGTTRFIKNYKARYKDWRLQDAIIASASVPTMFPVFKHPYLSEDESPLTDEAWIKEPRYFVDGGVGTYMNPCYIAAYEIAYCSSRRHNWSLEDTTLISIGAGKINQEIKWSHYLKGFRRLISNMIGLQWIPTTFDIFLNESIQEQVRLVNHAFVETQGGPDKGLDFRRYNIPLKEYIEGDQANKKTIENLKEYGRELGEKILNDERISVDPLLCDLT